MNKSRLESFSDGVFAIIITISAMGISASSEGSLDQLSKLAHHLFMYLLSFLYVGIYWINHHYLVHTLRSVTAGVLWSNLIFLFCLSLLPVATEWVGKSHGSPIATVFYGGVLLMSGSMYFVLTETIIKAEGATFKFKGQLAQAMKEKISILIYLIAIPLAFVNHWLAKAIFILVACLWIIPDRRIEKFLADK